MNALQGHKKAKKIAFNSKNKIRKLQKILKNLKNEKEDNKIIIFCRYNDTVKKISDKFLILHITHKTDKEERKEIMKKFKNGKYNSIVSAQILEEGVDVSSANIGIILSGTGSPRELIQRIGRILRPDGKIARIYEIISSKTNELNVRNKRWKKI
ncbi:MAG: helicase-related protein [archaeon]